MALGCFGHHLETTLKPKIAESVTVRDEAMVPIVSREGLPRRRYKGLSHIAYTGQAGRISSLYCIARGVKG